MSKSLEEVREIEQILKGISVWSKIDERKFLRSAILIEFRLYSHLCFLLVHGYPGFNDGICIRRVEDEFYWQTVTLKEVFDELPNELRKLFVFNLSWFE
jgi:hypothetical protein